jgi:plasmid maintenance system antidote protein VapI
MTETEIQRRKRAGAAVGHRLDELHLSAAQAARRAGVDPKTIRSLVHCESWPTARTRARIEQAVNWPAGEIMRHAADGDATLAAYTTGEILAELCRRVSNES